MAMPILSEVPAALKICISFTEIKQRGTKTKPQLEFKKHKRFAELIQNTHKKKT